MRRTALLDKPTGPWRNNGSALANSLVSYWKLDEVSGVRYDSKGTNNLTDNNTVTGEVGKVYPSVSNFVRTNSEYLSIASNTSVQTGDIDWWFAAWVYPATVPSSNNVYHFIMGKQRQSVAGIEYTCDIRQEAGVKNFQFNVSNNALTANLVQATNFGPPAASTWYFVVCYHDSVNNLIGISVNTTLTTTATTITPEVDDTPFEIGRFYSGHHWNGRIGPAMLGKGYIPTAADIAFLYNGGAGRA